MSLLLVAATVPTAAMALLGAVTVLADRGFAVDMRRRNRRSGRDGRTGGRRSEDLARV